MIRIGNYELFPYHRIRRCFLYPGLITQKDGLAELTALVHKNIEEIPLPGDLFIFTVKGTMYLKILCWNKEKHGTVTLTGAKANEVKALIS